MKKTTTRLATTTAVFVMTAFAILLAQHDARNNSQIEEGISTSKRVPADPPMPLALDNVMGDPQVVRGNNERAIDDRMTAYDNPLREDQLAGDLTNSLLNLGSELLDGEVVPASGEYNQPMPNQQGNTGPVSSTPQLQSLPAALADFPLSGVSGPSGPRGPAVLPTTSGSSGAVPNLSSPTGPAANTAFNGAGVPNDSNLPSTSAGIGGGSARAMPASQAAGWGQNALGNTVTGNTPSAARLGMPTAPPPLQNGSAPSIANNRSATASMSDTQRGAMIPTQFSDLNLPDFNANLPNTTPNQAPPVQPPSMPVWNSPAGSNSSALNVSGENDASGLGSQGAFGSGSMAPIQSPPTSSPTNFPSSNSRGATASGQPLGNTGFSSNADSFNAPSKTSPTVGFGGGSAVAVPQHGYADTSVVAGARSTLVSNQPGNRVLDGSQNPFMQIQKQAPEEITVGKKASFVIIVRNAGNSTAHDVTVVDRVPRGARFSEASPGVTPTADGVLVWKLGEMGPGDEKTINLQIIPEVEGEIGSIASVHIAAQASARSMATSPQIELQVDGAAPVIIGQGQQITVTARNSGTGVARGIRLETDIPNQLRHESGEILLEASLGDIRPGESKRLSLNLAAIQPGQSVCPLRAVNEDGVQAQGQFTVDVRAPQLAATISGPSRRYLDRQATYQIVVTNNGTATARNLYFDVHLPVGLKFVSADIAQATYHPQTHSVTLGLAELTPGANAAFSVTVLPVELGPQNIRFNATGDLGVSAEAKGQMVVEGLSELAFTISQDNGTVEVGATTTYAVQVSNVGNQSDKNVQLQIQLPDGARLIKVDAPVNYREEGGRLIFAAVGEMRSRDVKIYRFQVQHQRAGNQVVRAQLTSANWPVAVLKEEGTLVYNDQ